MTKVVPESLRGVEGLAALPLTASGVYFLCRDGEVRYVGKSLNVHGRLASHRAHKRYDAAYVVYCRPYELDDLERDWIVRLRPPENTMLAGHSARRLELHRRAEAYFRV